MKLNDQNKEKVLQTARLLFYRQGYENTTMRNIAAEAGVSVAMPNYYFTSKAALGTAVYAEVRRSVSTLADELFPGEYDLFPRIVNAVVINTYLTMTEPRYRELFLAIASSPQFYELMDRAADNIFAIADNSDVRSKYHAVAVGGIHAALLLYLDINPDESVKELVSYYVEQYIRPLHLSRHYINSMLEKAYEMVLKLDIHLEEGYILQYKIDDSRTNA